MRPGLAVRSGVLTAVVLAVLAGFAAPASAHTVSGPRPTNYRSQVISIEPALAGVSARVVDEGSALELTNRSQTEVVVLGYDGEQYLRIGQHGVFENLHSAATYLNRTRVGSTVPPDVDTSADAPPLWHKISDGHTARWHDHHIHWMQPQPPPQVQDAPDRFHRLPGSPWHVQLRYGGRQAVVTGTLEWVPGPSGWPWLPVFFVAFALGLVAAAFARWWHVLIGVLVGLVLVDIVHSVSYEIPRAGSNVSKAMHFLGGGYVSVIVWIVMIPTVIALARRRSEALYGVIFVGLMIALIGGLSDLSTLWHSQLPYAGPHWLTRAEVVVLLGIGAGILVGALVRVLRTERARARETSERPWLSVLVSGLRDDEVARIAADLDGEEVLETATRELATRLRPAADAFTLGALELAIMELPDGSSSRWTITREGTGDVRASRGSVEPVAATFTMPFAVALQVLAGTVPVDDPRVRCEGDRAFVKRIAPYVGERALSDRASAS